MPARRLEHDRSLAEYRGLFGTILQFGPSVLGSRQQQKEPISSHDAAKESNLPSGGLPRPAGFEDRQAYSRMQGFPNPWARPWVRLASIEVQIKEISGLDF